MRELSHAPAAADQRGACRRHGPQHSAPSRAAARPDPRAPGPELKAWREPDAAARPPGSWSWRISTWRPTHIPSAALRRAYQILSQLPPDQRQDPVVEADLASVLLQQNQLALAIQMFARAAAQQPSNARYAYCLGAALGRAGKMGEAIQELRRSIALDPSQPDPYLELACTIQKAGQEAGKPRRDPRVSAFHAPEHPAALRGAIIE